MFIEPFAGGGIIGLSIIFNDLADEVLLCELDDGVSSVWETILGEDWNWLIDQILKFQITRDQVLERLTRNVSTRREQAFQTILRNRVQRGGILAPGAALVKNGENGKGVASRWYPMTLATRITEIHRRREQIRFLRGDAFQIVPAFLRSTRNTFFVDPPYTAGGKSAGSRLYNHSVISHTNLFALMTRARGPVMLTYDDCTEVTKLAESSGFSCAKLPMKNTHHNVMYELLITNNAATLELSRRADLARSLSA